MVDFLLHRPVAVTMTAIAVLILGFVAASLLPVSLMPDVDIPKISVHISDENTPARELENTVVKPLRRQLNQLSHLDDIKSETRAGSAVIQLGFEYGTAVDYAYIEVNEKIDQAMGGLPGELDRPKVIRASATDIPVFYLALTLKDDQGNKKVRYAHMQGKADMAKETVQAGGQGSKTAEGHSQLFPVSSPFIHLSNFAGQVIRKRIEQLPSVTLADVSGRVFPEILIVPDEERLTSTGVTLADIETALQKSNIDLGNLLIQDGHYRYSVRVGNRLLTTKDIEQVYLRKEDRIWQIRDLAEVYYHPQEREGFITAAGKDAILIAVIKQSDARMKDLKEELGRLISLFKADYPDIDFTISRNQTRLLDYSIASLKQNLLVGALLAFMVMFLFLKEPRLPLLIGISIPVSLVVTLLFFYLAGLTVNIVSLSGMILGIGMMIDNAIIVVDNIHQYRTRGTGLVQACIRGTNEVFRPMLSAVLTTCAVFIPLIFIGGISGALFYDQAVAVAIGLFVSLLVSVTLLPVYYHLLYRKRTARGNTSVPGRISRLNYEKLYEKVLFLTFRRQGQVWIMVLLMLAGTVYLFYHLKKEKFPPLTKSEVMLSIDWNERVTPEENNRRVGQLLEGCGDYISYSTVLTGKQQFLLDRHMPGSAAEAMVYLEAAGPGMLDSLQRQLNRMLADGYPSAVWRFEETENVFEMIFSGDEPALEARLRYAGANDRDYRSRLDRLVRQLQDSITEQAVDPVVYDELMVLRIDAALLQVYGLAWDDVYRELKKAFRRNDVFMISGNQEFIPVVLGDASNSLHEVIRHSRVRNEQGEAVPLAGLLTVDRGKTLKIITAGEEGEYYPVAFEVAAGNVRPLLVRVRQLVSANPHFEADFTGSWFTSRELIRDLAVILVISLLLLYFILASQFESLVLPLIVLLEVPIDIFGAFLVLKIAGAGINLMSMIGIVVMSGIIVNDSILKIDTIHRLRLEGYGCLRAIVTGGQRRLKPILMTSLTTILALVPFLFTRGMGSDLQRPLAWSIIGGMTLGTLVSLFFIPLCYYQYDRLTVRIKNKRK